MQAPAHFGKPLPARLATAPACTAAQAATHQRRAARPQTHTLLMTRHPNHPNRPTNDRRTPDQHTIGTQQHVRACTDMQERFQHSHPCKPLSWLQQTAARASRHSPGMHSGTDSHTPADNRPAQTHTLLMTRHPNHPTRETNDRHTHTNTTRPAHNSTSGMHPHAGTFSALACMQTTQLASANHCPPVSPQPRHAQRHRQPHTSGEQPGTNSHTAHDATPKPPQQTNQ